MRQETGARRLRRMKLAVTTELVGGARPFDGAQRDSQKLAVPVRMRREIHALPRIVHFQRRAFPDQFSIECLFGNLREAMREFGSDATAVVAPYHSKGVWRRIANVFWAARHRADVNHITGDVHYLALGLPRKRTILTIHDCHTLERLSGWKRWLLRLLWYDLPIRRAAIVTVISDETKRQLARHLPAVDQRIVVVPNAVATVFRPSPRPFRSDCPQILQIGTKSNKNLPRLIQALEGLNCRLKIVGPLDQSLRDDLARGRIVYESVTQLDEAGMFCAYCECDMVSFVSTYEGFGMPIIEAQCVERPVVTSNRSSMPEVAGAGACFVDPFDVNSIRQGFERVINDSGYRENLIEHGRINRQRFELGEVALRYIELYEQLSPRENGN
jgi:glycosyltransferase involved in cell wall biosynthesis